MNKQNKMQYINQIFYRKPGLEQNVIINTPDEIIVHKTRKLGNLEGKGTVVLQKTGI